MAKQKRKEWKEMSKVEKTVGLVGVVIVGFIVLAIISGVIGAISDDNNTNDKPKETAKAEQKAENQPKEQAKEQPKEESKAKTIGQSDAENVCQDANFLQNYVDLSNTDIVTLSYEPYFTDMGDGTKSLQWNGKNKSSGSSILFVCDVARENNKVVVKGLAVDGTGVYGTALN